jgi:hypothetical protein
MTVLAYLTVAQATRGAAVTNWYRCGRSFEPSSNIVSQTTIVDVVLGASRLTNIVGTFPLIVNEQYATEYEGVSWGQPSSAQAWSNVLAGYRGHQTVYDAVVDDPGWIKGTRTAYGKEGAYFWLLENSLNFTTSESRYYTNAGHRFLIDAVMVGSIADLAPAANVFVRFPIVGETTGCNTNWFYWEWDNVWDWFYGGLESYVTNYGYTFKHPFVTTPVTNLFGSPSVLFLDESRPADNTSETVQYRFDTNTYYRLGWFGVLAGADAAVPGTRAADASDDNGDAESVFLIGGDDETARLTGSLHFGGGLVPGNCLWELVFTNGAPAASQWDTCQGTFADGATFNATWTGRTERIFDLVAWYDLDGDGQRDSDEMQRQLAVNIIKCDLVPDFNHDKEITDDDKTLLTSSGPFYFWINDDADDGNEADGDSDMPGQSGGLFGDANYDNSHVDGRCDLLDFFPVWIDLHDTLAVLPTSGGAEYKLKQANGAVKAVYTDLTKGTAGNFLDTAGNTYGPSFNQNSYEASTFEITSSGVTLYTDFLDKIKNDATKGILLIEGAASTTAPLVLEIWKDGSKVCEKEMPLKLSGVEDMYRMINLRPSGGPSTSTGEPANNPDSLSNGKNVFFLHGFNVNADQSRFWNAEMFKRLYQSGSLAKFWGMAWEGDLGLINALHYQESAANALIVSSNFNAQVGTVSGTKIVLAHSLGNMVVSGAIQDYNLSVNKYFMLDAAVATECYDPLTFNDATTGNYMLHTAWSGYDADTWCSKWFELFSSPDDREKLTWKDRFPAVLSVAYNYYSTGDEVLEVYTGTPSAFSGGLFHLERYAWQKQEMFKGREGLGGTDWAGWGFAGEWVYDPVLGYDEWVPEYTMAEANAATPDNLRTNAVFRHDPSTMFSSNITQQVVNNILAEGVPALSYATAVSSIVGARQNYDANVNKPNGWGRNDNTYSTRWLHSDLKDMAYFYTHDLFDQIVSQGGLQ